MRCAWILTLLLPMALPGSAADPIEGRWNLGAGQAVVDIRASDRPDCFEMVWVDGDDCSVLPGEIVGTLTAAPTQGLYDCRMPVDPVHGTNPRQWEATVTIHPDDPYSFTFGHYERRTTVSVRNLLPRWMRLSVSRKDTRPGNLDGGRRTDAPPRFVRL